MKVFEQVRVFVNQLPGVSNIYEDEEKEFFDFKITTRKSASYHILKYEIDVDGYLQYVINSNYGDNLRETRRKSLPQVRHYLLYWFDGFNPQSKN